MYKWVMYSLFHLSRIPHASILVCLQRLSCFLWASVSTLFSAYISTGASLFRLSYILPIHWKKFHSSVEFISFHTPFPDILTVFNVFSFFPHRWDVILVVFDSLYLLHVWPNLQMSRCCTGFCRGGFSFILASLSWVRSTQVRGVGIPIQMAWD